jgi:hypothetical protein
MWTNFKYREAELVAAKHYTTIILNDNDNDLDSRHFDSSTEMICNAGEGEY